MRRLALLVAYSASATAATSATVWATPHDSYSSSVGVLGCKVDTNRIAYWPQPVDCDSVCISVSYGDRSLHLLRVDQSQGAFDISYDAWNYLWTGHAATDQPAAGGPVEMQYRNVSAADCRGLLHTKGAKLPLSAANSMNFLTSCLDGDTWVGSNYALYNILDPICTVGHDEKCDLDWPDANQAECPHTMGKPDELKDAPVYNILYPSGDKVRAGKTDDDDSVAVPLPRPSMLALMMICLHWMLI